MVKLIQAQDHEVLVAMSFWALGHPITMVMGFVLSGLKAASDNEKVLSVSTTMVDGMEYGPANIMMFGVTFVLNMMGYAYFRYAIRLQEKEIPSTFTWLFFLAYLGLALVLIFPPIKIHLSPFQYGIQLIGSQIFVIFSIAWMGYFSQWMKSVGGRACFLLALAFSGILLVISWVLAAIADEESAAPVEWSSIGIIVGCHALVVFMCERDKVMKLNSAGFSVQVSATAQEYEQI
jgi:hypothetical protein